MSDLFDVSGKTALVTGGSRGIGLMIARGLVQAGARVIVSSRKSADVEAAAAELGSLGDCHAIPADISTQEGAQALAAATRERFPSLDILVNNAGAAWGAPLEEFPAAGWQKVLEHQRRGRLSPDGRAARGAARGRQRRGPRARDQHRLDQRTAAPDVENYSYSASKAAVHMLTRHLAKRLASEHITVNAIAPGPVPDQDDGLRARGPRDARGGRSAVCRSGASGAPTTSPG